MKKLVLILFGLALIASPVYATNLEDVFVGAYDSTNHALKVNVAGGSMSSDAITCDRIKIWDDTDNADYISMDVYSSHATFDTNSLSAIHWNRTSRADVDYNIASVGDPYAFYINAGDSRVGIGTATPTVSLDVIGTVSADNLSSRGSITVYDDATVSDLLSYDEADWTGGNVIYVPLAGDIKTYIAAATAGDTIVLAAGTYTITDDIDIAKAINVVGQGVGKTTIACATTSKNVFDISASNVRIANLSISTTGDSEYALKALGNLSGLVYENLDITMNAAGTQYLFYLQNCSATLRNITFSVTSSDNVVLGIWGEYSVAGSGNKTINCYNVKGTVTTSGASASYGVWARDTGGSDDVIIKLYDCNITASPVGANPANALRASDGEDAFIYAYNTVANGADTDVVQANSATLTLYDTTLVNGTTSGTITYDGTVVSEDFYASDDVTVAGMTAVNGGLLGTPDEITATDSGVAASVTTLVTEVTTNDDNDLDNVTLADGTSGQIKCFVCVSSNAGDTWKVTPAHMCGGTQITFGDNSVGDGCIMIYCDNEGWAVIGNEGGTVS